jgi:reactive intermediate/imine deaminase
MAAPRGYTHVVTAAGGKLVFISGQVAMDAEGNLVGEADFAAQAEQVFQNLAAALAAAGADFSHVVKFGFFITDIAQIGAAREVRDRYVRTANPPASTAVEVSRLVRPEFLVEVDAIAVVPE